MRNSDLDQMIEFATERLARDDHNQSSRLVRDMAAAWPTEPALAIVFSLASAAAALEDMVDTQASTLSAQFGYKLAALISADVFALEAMGHCPATGQDLLHFWRRVDPYFLNL